MASDLRRAIRDVVIVFVAFAVAGVVAGWLWHALWSPAPEAVGANIVGEPVFAADADFRGTGLYAAVAVVTGLVLGALCAWLFDRDEVVTLVAVLAGAFAAAWLMAWVGHGLGPPDPPDKVTRADQLEGLRDSLHAARTVIWTTLPAAAMAGFFVVLVTFAKRALGETSTQLEPTE